ncbi:MAG: hypothetical protein CBB92_03185 [Flammeovirgaceae bacterium TMED32]|nr:MAG: hypothetical protein CBB92_03185 [Flammeovirgaceae bacterium TMED32]|tara:strand:- start:115 stop:1065 length:951 start_codon:yes stop_codon:yes gene_type:complete
MRKIFLQHSTEFYCDSWVSERANQIKLYPINNDFQKIVNHQLFITNNPSITTHFDFFGNKVGIFNLFNLHNYLKIISKIEIEQYEVPLPKLIENPFEQWEKLSNLQNSINFYLFYPYQNFKGNKALKKILPIDFQKWSPYEIGLMLCESVYNLFKYEKGITNVNSSLDEIWDLKSGVCQDFSNILIQMCRIYGIPSRYVSGYISPEDHFDFRGAGATHAWVEIYVPIYGWIGLDPTNNCLAKNHHIKLSVGRNYNDCSPVKGVFRGDSNTSLLVNVQTNNSDKFDRKNNKIKNNKTNQLAKSNSFAQNQEFIQQQQ